MIYEPRDCNVGSWFNGASNVVVRQTPLPSTGRAARMFNGLGYWRSAFAQDQLDLFETFHLPLVPLPTASPDDGASKPDPYFRRSPSRSGCCIRLSFAAR